MNLIDNLDNTSQQLQSADFRMLSNALDAQIYELQKATESAKNSLNEKQFLSWEETMAHQDMVRRRLRVMILCLQNAMKLANIDNLDIYVYKNWRAVIELFFKLKPRFLLNISPEIRAQTIVDFWETSDSIVQKKIRDIFAALQEWEQASKVRKTLTISLVKPIHRIQDPEL